MIIFKQIKCLGFSPRSRQPHLGEGGVRITTRIQVDAGTGGGGGRRAAAVIELKRKSTVASRVPSVVGALMAAAPSCRTSGRTWVIVNELSPREPVILVRQLAVPMHPVLQYAVLAPVAHNAPLEHAEFDLPRASWLVMVVDGRSG